MLIMGNLLQKESLRPQKEDGGEKIRCSTPFLSLIAANNAASRAGILPKSSPRPLTDAFLRCPGKKRFQPVGAFSLVPSVGGYFFRSLRFIPVTVYPGFRRLLHEISLKQYNTDFIFCKHPMLFCRGNQVNILFYINHAGNHRERRRYPQQNVPRQHKLR